MTTRLFGGLNITEHPDPTVFIYTLQVKTQFNGVSNMLASRPFVLYVSIVEKKSEKKKTLQRENKQISCEVFRSKNVIQT